MKKKSETNLEKLISAQGLTEQDIETILAGAKKSPQIKNTNFKDYFQDTMTFAVVGDAHIGHLAFDKDLWKFMIKTIKKRNVSRVYFPGDILEGMSGREGHIYELEDLGFSKQAKHATELFKGFDEMPIFGIDGNHDDWYFNKNNAGVIVGEELSYRIPNYHHLGSMEADVEIRKGIHLMMFHPNDATAYADSYKLQKKIESMSSKEKPHILLEGHYHKQLYDFKRNVHAFECGTLSNQSVYMKGKKIRADTGFYIVEIELGKGGIGSIVPEFYSGELVKN